MPKTAAQSLRLRCSPVVEDQRRRKLLLFRGRRKGKAQLLAQMIDNLKTELGTEHLPLRFTSYLVDKRNGPFGGVDIDKDDAVLLRVGDNILPDRLEQFP